MDLALNLVFTFNQIISTSTQLLSLPITNTPTTYLARKFSTAKAKSTAQKFPNRTFFLSRFKMWESGILLVIITLIIVRKYFNSLKYKLPPGPLNLPLVGSLPHFILAGGTKPAKACVKLSKQYGPVFSLQTGFVPSVVVNGYDALKEISSNEDFQNRSDVTDKWILTKTKGLQVGLLFSRDNLWAETRAFCHTLLRKYGFTSKREMETLFMGEIKDFCEELKTIVRNGGNRLEIDYQFTVVFFNVVWTLLTGKRYPRDDPLLNKLVTATADYLKSGKLGGGIAGLYPGLIDYFPTITGYTELKQKCGAWCDVLQNVLDEHRKDPGYKTCPQNFIDEYLVMIDKHDGKFSNSEEHIYTDISLVGVVQNMILGGTDTEAHLMKFLIHIFLIHPEVQRKLQEEVDRVVGKNRLASIDDIPDLLYTQAVLWELLRAQVPVTMTVRKLTKDSKIGQYDIPAGTQILCNLHGANMDETIWENPTEFRPERFINPSGKIVNTEKVMSFGFGKRRCIGESLAKVNMILGVATIVQEFMFEVDPEFGILPEDADLHEFTRDLPPFSVKVKIRADE